jgi:hypothetical protein
MFASRPASVAQTAALLPTGKTQSSCLCSNRYHRDGAAEKGSKWFLFSGVISYIYIWFLLHSWAEHVAWMGEMYKICIGKPLKGRDCLENLYVDRMIF